jgi:hypothetical protein
MDGVEQLSERGGGGENSWSRDILYYSVLLLLCSRTAGLERIYYSVLLFLCSRTAGLERKNFIGIALKFHKTQFITGKTLEQVNFLAFQAGP